MISIIQPPRRPLALQKQKQTKLVYFNIGQLQAQTTNEGKVQMLMLLMKFYLTQLLDVVNVLLENL